MHPVKYQDAFSFNLTTMKLIKISDVHFIIVDDSEIKKDDWVCKNGNLNKAVRLDDIETSDKWKEVGWRKITHSTQPLCQDMDGSVAPFDLSEVKELISEVDVEQKVYSIVEQVVGNHNMQTSTAKDMVSVGISCYNQAIEDNKDKRYTDEDIQNAWVMGYRGDTFDEMVDYFKRPKTEWDVEFVEGKLKLKQ
jgi:hypothetical protein